MPILGQPKFNWEAPCRKAEFLIWEETAYINFEGNGNNDTKMQAAFMLDWLGLASKVVIAGGW